MFSSETYPLVDATYYNDGSRTTGMQKTSSASISTNGEYVVLGSNGSSEQHIGYELSYQSTDNFEISCVLDYTNAQSYAYSFLLCASNSLGGSSCYMNINKSNGRLTDHLGSSSKTYTPTFATGDKITIRRLNGNWVILHNDTVISTTAYTWTGERMIGHYTYREYSIYMKDIIIKPL